MSPAPNWGLTDDVPKDKIRPRPRGSVALRKLLEAKDAAVRAALAK